MARGFTKPPVRRGLYIFDSFKEFDGRRYVRSDVAPPQAPPGATTVVLQLEPVPFEQLGHPLPCAP